jgi:hypothetical protein
MLRSTIGRHLPLTGLQLRRVWLVWLVHSCCSHLEHRASVKRFVSLQFLNLRHSVGILGRVISPSQGCYLTQTQNKHKQTFMPRVGFEPTIPTFEREKTVHALDCAATVIGAAPSCCNQNLCLTTRGTYSSSHGRTVSRKTQRLWCSREGPSTMSPTIPAQ